MHKPPIYQYLVMVFITRMDFRKVVCQVLKVEELFDYMMYMYTYIKYCRASSNSSRVQQIYELSHYSQIS